MFQRVRRYKNFPFMNQQSGAVWTACFVGMDGTIGQLILRKFEGPVPKRARHQLAATGGLANLPVKPAENSREARVGRLACKRKRTGFVDPQTAGKKLQMGIELLPNAPLQMPGEQRRQSKPRRHHRDRHHCGSKRKQAQPEGLWLPHGSVWESGTR